MKRQCVNIQSKENKIADATVVCNVSRGQIDIV